MRYISLMLIIFLTTACTTSPPSDVNNICRIFAEKKGWYRDADKARDHWGSPISVMMAMMHQESRFRAKAKPPRKKILWVIPGPRPSSSYGYTQALDETWDMYIRNGGNYGADRDDFGDSIDFIGWYNHQSYKRSGIKKNDPYHLYLAYHEGQGGFNRRSYKNKKWLINVSKKVSRQSSKYTTQLQGCEKTFKKSGGFFGLF